VTSTTNAPDTAPPETTPSELASTDRASSESASSESASSESAPASSRRVTTAPQRWCIVTCEYPPIEGGVSDHTRLLAAALSEAGDSVDVWCPPAPESAEEIPAADRVTVHVLPSRFGLGAIRALRRAIRGLPADVRVLVQWVPTAFGWRMMNLPFALMLYGLPRRRLELYVHETGWEPSREPWRRALAGMVHRVMTFLAARSANRVFVTIPAWSGRLSLLGMRALPPELEPEWVPVPSNLPVDADAARATELRRAMLSGTRQRILVGHFGTYGRWHMALMPHVVTRLLDEAGDRTMLLVGRGGEALRDFIVGERPELAARIVVTGPLSPDEVSAHLAACDVLVQPYEDGASTRRGSLMAGVALGRPTVTNRGRYTEALWSDERPVQLTDSSAPHAFASAVTKLLADAPLRERLSAAARRVHAERFALSHGVATLRKPPAPPAERSAEER
jgi:glycosyltransferase involved in cell wall biosynthesis